MNKKDKLTEDTTEEIKEKLMDKLKELKITDEEDNSSDLDSDF